MIPIIKNFVRDCWEKVGVTTNKQLIVFCSDDWGGLRVKSKSSRDFLEKAGIDMNSNRFDRFDCLESNSDLENLFTVLLKFKDLRGNHPVFTAVTNVANPDFDRIISSEFQEYHYEPFTKTLHRYPNRDKVMEYLHDAIENKIWVPESHGREHLQIQWWMAELRNANRHSYVRKAFSEEYFALSAQYLDNPRHRALGGAFDLAEFGELERQTEILEDGLKLFQNIFGYKSEYFTAPALHYNSQLERTLHNNSVSWIDVARVRQMPIRTNMAKTKLHYLSQKNNYGQRYLVRNCVFESNMENNSDGVDYCLAGIERAFKNKKPAVISNHRASFVGGIDAKNGIDGVKALDRLLSAILLKWPNALFTSVKDLKYHLNLR